MSYDPACHDLAKLFIESDPNLKERDEDDLATLIDALAQEIQDAIDAYLQTFDMSEPCAFGTEYEERLNPPPCVPEH